MNFLPSLDFHSHINTSIESNELSILPSINFAMTRSLDEAEIAISRADENTIWGIGCHPGLLGAQRNFIQDRFSTLLDHTAVAGELGLDGKSRVAMTLQQKTLINALEVLSVKPRLTSLHSYEATEEVLEILERHPIKGAILHWWLGNEAQTKRAIALGCFFSINASSVKKSYLLDLIPIKKILTETDHPYGDRFSTNPKRPGQVTFVEERLGLHYNLDLSAIRLQVWKNFGDLIRLTDSYSLLPKRVRTRLAAIRF